jgi:hypothetical protein
MSTIPPVADVPVSYPPVPPREDFPVEVYRHLEGRLQHFRRSVMAQAARRAAAGVSPFVPVYTVTREDVDQALAELVDDKTACRSALGFAE